MVDDPIDQGGGGGGVGKDAGPLTEGQVGGQDEALPFVAAADDLEEQVGVATVIGEVADFVQGQDCRVAVVTELGVQGAGGFLGAKVEEKLSRREEEDGVTGQDGLIGDILSDHGLAQALGGHQNEVAVLAQEVELQSGLDRLAIDLLGPAPVEVGHGFEAADLAAGQAPFQASPGAFRVLGFRDVLQELGGTPTFSGGQGDGVVQVSGGVAQAESDELFSQWSHVDPPRFP